MTMNPCVTVTHEVEDQHQGAHSRLDMCMWDLCNFNSRSTLDAPLMHLSAKKPKKENLLNVVVSTIVRL